MPCAPLASWTAGLSRFDSVEYTTCDRDDILLSTAAPRLVTAQTACHVVARLENSRAASVSQWKLDIRKHECNEEMTDVKFGKVILVIFVLLVESLVSLKTTSNTIQHQTPKSSVPTLLRNGNKSESGGGFQPSCLRDAVGAFPHGSIQCLCRDVRYSSTQSGSGMIARIVRGQCSILLLLALLLALLPLFLALASVFLDLLGWRVLDEFTLLVEASPLGQTVGDIDAALAVEHVKS